jgi:hypothetical protein
MAMEWPYGRKYRLLEQNIMDRVGTYCPVLRVYHTLQGDNSLKSVERFDHNNNNFYWSKNPNKGLSSIQNITNTTKTTLSTQYLIT